MYTTKSAPFRPSGTFPRFAGEGLESDATSSSLPLRVARGKVPKAEGGALVALTK